MEGTYGYTDSYGIYRQVDYVADKHGFRATIKTNEPGTASQSLFISKESNPMGKKIQILSLNFDKLKPK